MYLKIDYCFLYLVLFPFKHWNRMYYLFIYQLFWTQAFPEGMCTNGTQVPCKVPSLPNPTIRKGWPHHRGLLPLLFSNSCVGSFTSHKNKSVKVLWDGTYNFSSLSEKTRRSNHLQMSLQRQHFLLSFYNNTWVLVWPGFEVMTSQLTSALPTELTRWWFFSMNHLTNS